MQNFQVQFYTYDFHRNFHLQFYACNTNRDANVKSNLPKPAKCDYVAYTTAQSFFCKCNPQCNPLSIANPARTLYLCSAVGATGIDGLHTFTLFWIIFLSNLPRFV